MTTELPGTWNEPDTEVLDQLTRLSTFSADTAVCRLPADTVGTVKTEAAVRGALRMLLAQGIITAVPRDDWPQHVRIDAPGEDFP